MSLTLRIGPFTFQIRLSQRSKKPAPAANVEWLKQARDMGA